MSAVDTHIATATRLLRDDRLEEAGREIEAARLLAPTDVRVRNLRGLLCFRAGHHDEARRTYLDLLSERPADPALLANLGVTELRMGMFAEAAAHFAALTTLEPDNTRAWGHLGLARLRSGEFGAARAALAKSGRTDLLDQVDAHEQRHATEKAAAVPLPETLATVDVPVEIEVDSTTELKRRNQGTRRSDELLRLRSTIQFGRSMLLDDFIKSRLVEPGPADESFRLTPDGLLIERVGGRLFSRTAQVVFSTGQLVFEPIRRRERGSETSRFGAGDGSMCLVKGHGMIVASPGAGTFCLLQLDDDALYVRESKLHAFEDALSFENGRIPGESPSDPTEPNVVQLRGRGAVVIVADKSVHTVQLAATETLYIALECLLGWTGRVVPRRLKDEAGNTTAYVECAGEGVVVVERADGIAGRTLQPSAS